MRLEDEYKNNNYSSIVNYISQIAIEERSFNHHYYYIKSLNRKLMLEKSIPYAKSLLKEKFSVFNNLKILYELIWAYHKEGNWDEIEMHIDTISPMVNKLRKSDLNRDDKLTIATIDNLIGLVHYSLGKLNSAMSYFNQVLENADEIQNEKLIQGAKINIAMINLDRGEYIEAINFLIEGYELAEKNKYLPHMRVAANNLTYIYATIGNLAKAEEFAIITIKITKKMNDKWGLALILNNLGQIMYKRGNYEEALKHLDQNYKLMKEFGNPEYILRGLFYKLLIQLDLQNRFDASKIIQEMRSYANQSYNSRSLMIYQLAYGIYLKYSGLYRDKVKAENKLKNLINNYDEIESEHISYAYLYLIELLLEQLSEIYKRSHDEGEELKMEAEEILLEIEELSEWVLNLAEEQNVPELKLQVHYIYSHIAILRSKTKEIYYHLKEAESIAQEWGLEKVTISEPDLEILGLISQPLGVKHVRSINEIIHSLPRLKIMITLSRELRITFSKLQEIVELSSGNLSNHCKVLIDRGYVDKQKELVGDKFQIVYSMTNHGIQAFDNYISKFKTFFST